jgi:hypothetical protein
VRRPAAVPAAGRSSADRRHCDRASRTALQPHEWAGAEARAGGRSSIGCMPNRTLSTVSTPRSAVIHCTLGARAVPVLQWAVSASCGHTGESAPRKAPAQYNAAPCRRSDAVALACGSLRCACGNPAAHAQPHAPRAKLVPGVFWKPIPEVYLPGRPSGE